MLYEFNDVFELNEIYEQMHISKKINQPIIIKSPEKDWIFDIHNVEQTMFEVCNNKPVIICICSKNTVIIRYINNDFVKTIHGEFQVRLKNQIYTRDIIFDLKYYTIRRAPLSYTFEYDGLTLGKTKAHYWNKNLSFKYKRFVINRQYIEILTEDYESIYYSPILKLELSDIKTSVLSHHKYGYDLVYDPNKHCIRAYGQLYNHNKHLLIPSIKKQLIFLFWLIKQKPGMNLTKSLLFEYFINT